jgi:excisionase family DNA binding protein
MTEALKLLFTVKEAAARLAVPMSWLYERTRKKTVPCRRLGKYIRFTEQDLLDIVSGATPPEQGHEGLE